LDRLAAGGGGLAAAGRGFAHLQNRPAVLLVVRAAGTAFRPSHDHPFPRRPSRASGRGFAALAVRPLVLLVRGGRRLVPSVAGHAQHPGHRSVLALAAAAGGAGQPELADGSRQQGGDGVALRAAGHGGGALPAQSPGLSGCAASLAQELRHRGRALCPRLRHPLVRPGTDRDGQSHPGAD